MARPPTGTVTFLFAEIAGSARLWEDDAPAMQAALSRHEDLDNEIRRAMRERLPGL